MSKYCLKDCTHTKIPQTKDISNAVGNIWNTIEVRRKLIPFVPLSMARVRPPVCRVKWKFKSSRSRWSNTFWATLLMVFCATLAKTAFRSSWNNVAPILDAPSKMIEFVNLLFAFLQGIRFPRTSNNHRSRNCECSATESRKIDIHRVDNIFKIKGNLNIEDLREE